MLTRDEFNAIVNPVNGLQYVAYKSRVEANRFTCHVIERGGRFEVLTPRVFGGQPPKLMVRLGVYNDQAEAEQVAMTLRLST